MDETTTDQLTVGQAIQYCWEQLHDSAVFYGHGTDNPWDEAVQLVLAVAGLPADAGDGVLPHVVSVTQRAEIERLLKRRIEEHVPLPYLLGKAWFAGLEFGCDPRAIIPRSPIAELILHDYQPWYAGPEPARILDMCCGGGCIGLAAAYYSKARVDLVDLDPEALALAAENRERLGLAHRVQIHQSDLFDALAPQRYDLILSNPPYVDAGDLASMPAEYHHEPELALGSGPDGLSLTRRILARAADYLSDTGLLVVEVGNSWEALEAAYPRVPFTWLEFEHGGHGVFALSAAELQEFSASLSG
ncbi:50S ribosomal protein L3 N(5)-glutamine methyltransferase [Seongchinamella sediminis]|uniref:50S ribosomal protein L3 N(5)-glutamine methyltransferase n=1 Tax=Seongchinamella sediminis TaxID=2283635 RepID=A0A3L7DUL4_9GAMM|nr:50S ribosomal protein L3 N(5)-glutamine methyltransferase [Seongchinamella sediminis]RLQ20199.1 50S ribosomal protein L3 N(5)-glutamine methyltransferase [Seongchinamella sediminis]